MAEITATERPLMGIGSCLAGNPVRYNGQTKSPNQHVRSIADNFQMRAFCPEMAAGMGVPREPIHLVGSEDHVRALDVDTHSQDYTHKIRDHAATVLELAPKLSGYILVKGSPSCGYERVKRYAANGYSVASDQQGIFAAALAVADPLLPLEDDGRLNDPGLRESFVTRAFTYHKWKQLQQGTVDAHTLITFYSSYKYLVMAHHVPSYKNIGRLLADAGTRPIDEVAAEFISMLMAGLTHRATQRSHTNVLFHLSGYLKRKVSAPERQRLNELIEQYRQGHVPLVVPVTLLRHHFSNHPNAYIDQQVFMAPYPDEMRLRNLM